MPKIRTVLFHLGVGTMLLSYAPAQQTPAAQSKPASKPATSSTPKTGAKKPATSATKASPSVSLTTQKEKTSYAVGVNIGMGLQRQGAGSRLDAALVARGLKDSLSGGKLALSEDEIKTVLQQLRAEVMKEQEAKAKEQEAKSKAAAEPNRKEADTFLAANKSKEGVKALPDGLQYKVVKEGTGPKPTASDTVTVNYRGTLINGTEFDSSYKRGQPASFSVGGVIRGWTEALQLMPVGSKWELYIPPDQAYGDNPPPGSSIPPGSALIFEVELLSIAGKQ